MPISLLTFLIAFCLAALVQPAAAVGLRDWLGRYALNHDGWQGTLTISESKADCAAPKWCALVLQYVDAKGNAQLARIERMDERLQHMRFTIAFPKHRQQFDAYLFSHDTAKMAGVTYWQGKPFGFVAERKPVVADTERAPGRVRESAVSRSILPSGEVERRYANGMIERISSGKIVRIMPNGTQQTMLMQQVIPLAPPPPPPGSREHEWLAAHAQQLLDMIVALAVGDPAARENYLATEGDARNVYERIAHRTRTMAYLTQP